MICEDYHTRNYLYPNIINCQISSCINLNFSNCFFYQSICYVTNFIYQFCYEHICQPVDYFNDFMVILDPTYLILFVFEVFPYFRMASTVNDSYHYPHSGILYYLYIHINLQIINSVCFSFYKAVVDFLVIHSDKCSTRIHFFLNYRPSGDSRYCVQFCSD